MFICEKCLEQYDNEGIMLSWGKCEDCGKIAACYEIRYDLLRKIKG